MFCFYNNRVSYFHWLCRYCVRWLIILKWMLKMDKETGDCTELSDV